MMRYLQIAFLYFLIDIMGKQMDEVIGEIDVELDGKFASVRTTETNLGKSEYLNIIVSAMRTAYD